MDPPAADSRCVVQALRASSNTRPAPPPPIKSLHSPAAKDHAPGASSSSSRPPKPKRRLPRPTALPLGPAPPSPRRTRSGGSAPEWTPAETLALVAEVAGVDDGWSRSVSAFQKWAMVSENLAASEVFASGPARRGKRAAGECKRRWEALAAEYGAVRRWEVRTGGGYWKMSAAARRKAGLPSEFDAEVYGTMDALVRVEEALLANAVAGGGAGEEVEGLVGSGAGVAVGEENRGEPEICKEQVKKDELVDEVQKDESGDEEEDEDGRDDEEATKADPGNADASNTIGCEAETYDTENNHNIAWELANKLQECAQHIHTILNEEASKYADENHTPSYSLSPDAMGTTRQKADDLIKSLGGLLSYLNQFTELIKETGFENVGMT